MGKKISVWVLMLVVFLGINATVVFGAFVRHFSREKQQLGKLGVVVMMIAQFPSQVKRAVVELENRSPLIIENRFPEIDGFKKNGVLQEGALKDDGYLLLSAYDKDKKQSIVKLIRIRTQQILHEWIPNIQELTRQNKNEITASALRLFHPMLLDDGGILFKNGGPLFKINACSNIEWKIDGDFHHSLERGPDGNFWVPLVIEPTSFNKAKFIGYRDDGIAQVSPDGVVLFKKSVSQLLEENGYRGLLLGIGPYDEDAIHLNEIQPALYSTKYWKKGDLLLSLRHRSTVLLYRPSSNKVIWLKTGPWLNQHDPNFVGNSQISIFGNDVMRTWSIDALVDGYNNIYVFDFVNGSISTPYKDVLKRLDVRTLAEGRQKILDGGDAFVEETGSGRILRISPKKAVWEFTVKVDDHTMGLLNWSRYLTKEQVENVLPILEKSQCS